MANTLAVFHSVLIAYLLLPPSERLDITFVGITILILIFKGFLFMRQQTCKAKPSRSSSPAQHVQSGEAAKEQSSQPQKRKASLSKDKKKTLPPLSMPKTGTQSKSKTCPATMQSSNSITQRKSKLPRPTRPQTKLPQTNKKNKVAASKPSEQNQPKLHTTDGKDPIVKKKRDKLLQPVKRDANLSDYKRPTGRVKKDSESKEKVTNPHPKRHTIKHQIPEIHYKLEKGFFMFTIDQNGGKLELPFLLMHFPCNCVEEQMELRLKAVRVKDMKRDKTVALVTPAIHLSRKDEFTLVSFKCPVKLQVRPLYYVKNHPKEVKLQRTDNSIDMNWETIKTLNFREEQEFIPVELKRFAGFRVICDNSASLVPAYDLFHALFVKRPTGISDPLQHNFYVLIHSSDTRACNEAYNILNSSTAETVCYKHSLLIRPPCAFTASLVCDGMTSDPEPVNYRITTPGGRFLKTLPISLKKEFDEPIHPLQHVTLTYTAWSVQPEDPTLLQFQWSVPAETGSFCPSCSASNASGLTFNVNGERAIGQQHNYHNCTIQTPTPSEESPNLPHNSSEPLLHEHPPLQVLRGCSYPGNLHSIQPQNETNAWFRDNSPSYPSSGASTVVENVGISAHNVAVPETNSGSGNRNSTAIFRNSTVNATETVPKDIASATMQEMPTNLSSPFPETVPKHIASGTMQEKPTNLSSPFPVTRAFSQSVSSNSIMQNYDETVPKDVAGSTNDEQNRRKEISLTSALSTMQNVDCMSVSASFDRYLPNASHFQEATTTVSSETVPKDIPSITSLPRPAIITSTMSGTKPNFDYAKNCQNIVGSEHINPQFSSLTSQSGLTGIFEETQNFQNEIVPKNFGPSVFDGTSTHCLSLVSVEKNFDETVPKDIADVSAFEASSPIIHSTPSRPSNLTDSQGFVIGCESSLRNTCETTPDSGIDFDASPEGDKM